MEKCKQNDAQKFFFLFRWKQKGNLAKLSERSNKQVLLAKTKKNRSYFVSFALKWDFSSNFSWNWQHSRKTIFHLLSDILMFFDWMHCVHKKAISFKIKIIMNQRMPNKRMPNQRMPNQRTPNQQISKQRMPKVREYRISEYRKLVNTKSGNVKNLGHLLCRGKCSVSRWRPQKVDKRMVLDHTHGLFIT